MHMLTDLTSPLSNEVKCWHTESVTVKLEMESGRNEECMFGRWEILFLSPPWLEQLTGVQSCWVNVHIGLSISKSNYMTSTIVDWNFILDGTFAQICAQSACTFHAWVSNQKGRENSQWPNIILAWLLWTNNMCKPTNITAGTLMQTVIVKNLYL